ncbi:hypothetical protein FRC09_014134 [Ceratobasidium sp. 395]|nr:hypothetical protein FRC09_014134 [Ceratobasidium sp. 395]
MASIYAAALNKCTGHPDRKLNQKEAVMMLRAAGIRVPLDPSCPSKPTLPCISLNGIRCVAVTDVIAFKKDCGCNVTIRGGTEGGHSDGGPGSHMDGYKLDINATKPVDHECLYHYISTNFKRVDKRHWRSAAGDLYYNYLTFWDVTYHHPDAN